MCRVLRVARSGWYARRIRRLQLSPRQQFRRQCDKAVSQAFHQAKQRYGAPRITDELREQGEIQHQNGSGQPEAAGVGAKAARKFSPVSYKPHNLPVFDNLLNQDFTASAPNQKWVQDITYIRTDEGWLYLAVVIDLWSRAVIGWSMSSRMTARLVCDALQMALWRRKRPKGL